MLAHEDGYWFACSRGFRKNLKMVRYYKHVKSLPVESFQKNLEMAKDSCSLIHPQKREGLKIWLCLFQIDHVSLTSTDSYHCDSYCLARVFQNPPAPPKHYGVFDVLADFSKFFSTWKLGVALSSVHQWQISTTVQGKQFGDSPHCLKFNKKCCDTLTHTTGDLVGIY